MDGFVCQELKGHKRACKNALDPARGTASGREAADVMGYHDAREIPNYWTYAHDFVLQDHMFEPKRLLEPPGTPIRRVGMVGQV